MLRVPLACVRRILCLGAHADDIEIGAGGTLMQLIRAIPDLEIYWVVFSAPGLRAEEATRSAGDFLEGIAPKQVRIGSFRESYFPGEWSLIKEWFEDIRSTFDPDVVFTHYGNDRHQDHRVLSDLAWNTFRNHLILEYEIPKYDGDLGSPNVFVPLPQAICVKKIEFLLKHFKTQLSKHWFTSSTFDAMHRIRGVECASPTGFAEAFYTRKMLLAVS
jgi:LmbE family N-acetylglucosaminyl deacetylase